MENPTFYWYDFETFGLDKETDRPSQFAGQRTDLSFNPIGEGEVFYNKPSMDYLPSAQSCLLTGITPQICMSEGVVESEFAQEVWNRLNEPGTISLGYNSLTFDDDVARFLFWRNFLDPNSHQSENGCSRWDIYPLVCAVWALRGDGMNWPRWEDISVRDYPAAEGRTGVCMKLEFLTKANKIPHNRAHNALSDVNATIGLAKKIAETEPRLWQWAFEHRSKETIRAALEKGPVLWIHPRFGQKRGYAKIVQMIGLNPRNENEVFVWDLAYDPEGLAKLSQDEIRERLFPNKAKREAGVIPLPIYRLHVDEAPFVCDNLKVLTDERAAHFGINKEGAVANVPKLLSLLPSMQKPIHDWVEEATRPEPLDVDQGLKSDKELSVHDHELCKFVRGYEPEQLSRAIEAGKLKFDDVRLDVLLARYRARNWPELMSAEEQKEWKIFCSKRLFKGDRVNRTVTDYFNEIDAFQEIIGEDEELTALMDTLYTWGEYVGSELSDESQE